jgi:hypothetical protein
VIRLFSINEIRDIAFMKFWERSPVFMLRAWKYTFLLSIYRKSTTDACRTNKCQRFWSIITKRRNKSNLTALRRNEDIAGKSPGKYLGKYFGEMRCFGRALQSDCEVVQYHRHSKTSAYAPLANRPLRVRPFSQADIKWLMYRANWKRARENALWE